MTKRRIFQGLSNDTYYSTGVWSNLKSVTRTGWISLGFVLASMFSLICSAYFKMSFLVLLMCARAVSAPAELVLVTEQDHPILFWTYVVINLVITVVGWAYFIDWARRKPKRFQSKYSIF